MVSVMKSIDKFWMCVLGLCSLVLFSCSSDDDDAGGSGLQNNFFNVENGEYVDGELPVGTDDMMLQSSSFDASALPGGSSFLTLRSNEELSEVNLSVKGQAGYIRVPLSDPDVVSAEVRSTSLYEYTVLVLISQNLEGNFTIEFTTVNKDGEVSSKVTKEVSYVEAGTGSLQVNLRFSNEKDIDLYVVEPNGNVICYDSPFPYYSEEYQALVDWDEYDGEEPAWGTIGLDVDSNAGCEIDGINSENIFFDESCLQKGTYQVWVNMYSNCNPSIPTGYVVLANYKGNMIVNNLPNGNPASGEFPINTPDNPIGDELTGATKVMEFTVNEGREPGRSRASMSAPKALGKGFVNQLTRH